MNWMIIKNYLVFINQKIMIVNFDRAMIVRDWKDKNLSMKFFLTLYCFIQLNDIFHDNNYIVNVLSINNIENRCVAFHLACKEREVHSRRNHKINNKFKLNLIHERFKLFKMIICERRLFKSYKVIELWTSIMKRYCAVSVFVDAFI